MTKVMRFSPETLLAVSVFLMLVSTVVSVPFVGQFFIWFPPFALGMYFAGQNGFETIRQNNQTLPKQITLSVLLILLFAFVRFLLSDTAICDALFALAVILFSFFVLSRIPFLSPALEKLGTHSGSIFMFHTFIYSMYFEKFIYWFQYPPLIFIVLTVICFAVAAGLEALKKLVRYDKLMQKVIS